jgi:hypothetical protein
MLDGSATGLSGFRNRIINGDMRIDQRNAGASVTPTDGQFSVDRWRCGLNQASKFSIQQSTVTPSGFNNSLLVTSLSAYSVGSSDLFLIEQRVEGFNTADLGWGTASAAAVTLSFWVRSSLTGTFGGSLRNSDNARSYPFTYTISAANTFEYKTVTIPGDTSGTWLTTNGTGVQVTFGLGVGSGLSGTAGSWAGSAFLSATGATSVVGTNGATFYITGVQLEAGSVATPFERVDYSTSLMRCYRYHQGANPSSALSMDTGRFTAVLYMSSLSATSGTQSRIMLPMLAEMRSAPTVSFSDNNANLGKVYFNVSNSTASVFTSKTSTVSLVGTCGATGAHDLFVNYTLSAEL